MTWSLNISVEDGCEYTVTAGGEIDETVSLTNMDGTCTGEMAGSAGGGGSIETGDGCSPDQTGSVSADLTLISFVWDCSTGIGSVIIKVFIEPTVPGEVVGDELTINTEISGRGSGPFAGAASGETYTAAATVTLDHDP